MGLYAFDYFDGHFYYTGFLRNSTSIRSIILKTDTLGGILWSKRFIHLPIIYQLHNGSTHGWDILTACNENKLYVVTNGVINKGWGGLNLQDCEGWNRNVTHITLIDTAGNVLYDYEDPESSRFTSKIQQDSQGNLVYCGGVGLPELQKPPWCLPNYLPSITKLSTDFNKMWDYVCVNAQPVSGGSALPNFYTSLNILENDDVLASGFIIRPHHSQTVNHASYRVDIITKLNTNGELKWERYYSYLTDTLNTRHII